jgi:hypothetical protein
MHIIQAKQCLKAYIQAGIPTFLEGPPGVGKSDITYQVSDELSAYLVEERASTLESIDMRGLPFVYNIGNLASALAGAHADKVQSILDQMEVYAGPTVQWAKPHWLDELERAPAEQLKILFLDELVQASLAVQVACFQLVWNGRIGPHKLPPHTIVVAAGNRQADRAGANRMPTALANRFGHIDVEVDSDTWQKWANVNGIEPLLCAFLKFRPASLHRMPEGNVKAFPSPRSWVQVAKILHAADDIRPKLIEGLVGEGDAAELEKFIQMYKHLPSFAEIIARPQTVAVPTQPDIQHAVASMLSRKADRTNFDAICVYAGRLPKEFEVSLVSEAVQRDAGLKTTKGFIAWASRNSDITI